MPKFKSFTKRKNKLKNKLISIDGDGIKKCSTNNTIDASLERIEKSFENNLKLKEMEENDGDNNNLKLFKKEKENGNEIEEEKKKMNKLKELEEEKLMRNFDDKSDFILPEEQCDIPSFKYTKNCDPNLIDETRLLLKERYAKNPESFYDDDFKRMLTDDWTVTRFLLRRRLDPKRTAKLMEECGRFRKQYKMSEVQLWEFPIEFHKAGGLFMYAPDRVGNSTVYMRVKMYRRVPEISDVFKAFILCVIEQADIENNGRGFSVIFDLTGCGLKNVDLSFLSWLLSAFRNYCPKGCSYILVYNLPWILNATCKLAMTWMSANNKRALRFVHGDEIENFIAPENLPDYCGGTCKLNYRQVPKGSKRATEVCGRLDIEKKQAIKIKELFKEYLSDDDYEDDDDDDDDDNEHDNSSSNFDKDNETSSNNNDDRLRNDTNPANINDSDDYDEYCTDEDDDDDEDDDGAGEDNKRERFSTAIGENLSDNIKR